MKIVTVNVPSKAEHQGDALLYSPLRSFYARFLFSEKFREFNTATACERILSHITTDNSQNILIMQVNDDPVVAPELQLFNKVDPLIASTRENGRNVINRVMFRVKDEMVELNDGTFKNANELVHHNVPWQYLRLWNTDRNENRNPYHVIDDFIYNDVVPDQKEHGKSEKEHRAADNEEEADQITRTAESIGKGIFNLLFFLFFIPVIPGGLLVNLLNKYHALQTRHPKRAMFLTIVSTLAFAGLIIASIFVPVLPLIPLIIGLGTAWLVGGPFDVIANWFNKKIRHADIDMGILQRILRIAFVLYNLCITGVSFLCAAIGQIISYIGLKLAKAIKHCVLSLFAPYFLEEYFKLFRDPFIQKLEKDHKWKWLNSKLAKAIFSVTFGILLLPLTPILHLLIWKKLYLLGGKEKTLLRILFAFKLLSFLYTLAAIALITACIFSPFAPLAPLIIGLSLGWLFAGPFDILLGNWVMRKVAGLRNFLQHGLLFGVVELLVKGAVKISSFLTVIGAAIGSPIISIAKFIAARPILRYTITALLIGLAFAAPFLAPVIWPALALGLTAVPMKIALGLSYVTTLLPPLFPEKLWQACKQHKFIAIVMVLLLAASIAVPFVGIGTGVLFGAALLSKLAAVVISAASSLLISWIGLKIADCSPCCNIEDKKESHHEPSNSYRENSYNKIHNGLDYNSLDNNRSKDSNIDSNEDTTFCYSKNHNNIHETSTKLLYGSDDGTDKEIEYSNGYNS